jgi:FtsZ-interacting cell division protein ZipA
MEPGQIAVFIPIIALCIPIVAIWVKHKERMEEIRSRATTTNKVEISAELRAELSSLKEQVLALRDTTTKFDLSFDSALDSMEERMKRVEERQLSQNYQTTDDAQKLTLGR